MPEKGKYKPGQLTDAEQCAQCGEPVSIDNEGRVLCYLCAKFVDAVQRFRKGTDTQIPLFKNGWGMPE